MNRELIESRPNCVPDASDETVFYSRYRCFEMRDGRWELWKCSGFDFALQLHVASIDCRFGFETVMEHNTRS